MTEIADHSFDVATNTSRHLHLEKFDSFAKGGRKEKRNGVTCFQCEQGENKAGYMKEDERRNTMRKIAMLGILVGFLMAFTCLVYGADAVTVKGEVIDTYCFALMGAKGESHRQCAMDCINAGIPAGLLEEGTGKVYVLLPNKDKTGLPKGVMDKCGRTATITGKVYTSGGSQFLTVESIK